MGEQTPINQRGQGFAKLHKFDHVILLRRTIASKVRQVHLDVIQIVEDKLELEFG